MQLGAWTVFAVVLSRLRSFYGVMLGTFVLSYMGNTVIQISMRRGNEALKRCDGCLVFGSTPMEIVGSVNYLLPDHCPLHQALVICHPEIPTASCFGVCPLYGDAQAL